MFFEGLPNRVGHSYGDLTQCGGVIICLSTLRGCSLARTISPYTNSPQQCSHQRILYPSLFADIKKKMI